MTFLHYTISYNILYTVSQFPGVFILFLFCQMFNLNFLPYISH